MSDHHGRPAPRRLAAMAGLGLLAALGWGAPGRAQTLLETTYDNCRSEDMILVYRRYFDIDGPSQTPVGSTGTSTVAIPKGSSNVRVALDDRHFRWLCGRSPHDVAIPNLTEACRKAIDAEGPAAICPVLSSLGGEILRGILGNWEATRCAQGTRYIIADYSTAGRITWRCYR